MQTAVEHGGPYDRRRPVSTRLGQVPNLADGSAAGVDVGQHARLSEQLSRLAFGVAQDGTGLVDDLDALVATLTSAVSGYAGLRLTIVHTSQPIQLTSLVSPRPDEPVVTSLRLALRPASDDFEEGGWLVVWSTVPGSLVDLAADLSYVLPKPADGSAGGTTEVVQLDLDLPMPDAPAAVDGLDEFATIHRAAGLLIGQGQDPDAVYTTLRRGASGEGTSTYLWAVKLLQQR